VVDEKPFTMQLSRDPSIAIAREFQTERFNPSLESLFMILLGRRWLLRRVIEATSRKIHELAPPLDSLREVPEKESSLVSAFSRVCFKAFFKFG
jgi:hypothetical protein